MKRFISCLVAGSLIASSVPITTFAAVAQKPSTAGAWARYFEANPGVLRSLQLPHESAMPLANILDKATASPDDLSGIKEETRLTAIGTMVRFQALVAALDYKQRPNQLLSLSNLEKREQELRLFLSFGLRPDLKEELARYHSDTEVYIKAEKARREELALSRLKDVRWEGGDKAGADPVVAPDDVLLNLDGQLLKIADQEVSMRQDNGSWKIVLNKASVSTFEKSSKSDIAKLIADGNFKFDAKKQTLKHRLTGTVLLGYGIMASGAGLLATTAWFFGDALTAVLPPIMAAGAVGFSAFRHLRSKKSAKHDRAQEPIEIDPVLQKEPVAELVLQGEQIQPRYPAEIDQNSLLALLAMHAAWLDLRQAKIPLTIQRIQLIGHRAREDDAPPEYLARYDSETKTLLITADTLLSRWEALKKKYPEIAEKIRSADVAIPVLLAEAAKAGAIEGPAIEPNRLADSSFTDNLSLLSRAEVLGKAKALLEPKQSSRVLGRIIAGGIAAAIFAAGVPFLAGSVGLFHAGMGWAEGLLAATKASTFSLWMGMALLPFTYALHGSLAKDVVLNTKGAKEESAVYKRMGKMKALPLVGMLIPAAVIEELIFRGGLFQGFQWWLGLLPIGGLAALWGATAISSYFFAKAHPGSSRVERTIALFLGGALFVQIYLLAGTLIWPIIVHALSNINSFMLEVIRKPG